MHKKGKIAVLQKQDSIIKSYVIQQFLATYNLERYLSSEVFYTDNDSYKWLFKTNINFKEIEFSEVEPPEVIRNLFPLMGENIIIDVSSGKLGDDILKNLKRMRTYFLHVDAFCIPLCCDNRLSFESAKATYEMLFKSDSKEIKQHLNGKIFFVGVVSEKSFFTRDLEKYCYEKSCPVIFLESILDFDYFASLGCNIYEFDEKIFLNGSNQNLKIDNIISYKEIVKKSHSKIDDVLSLLK